MELKELKPRKALNKAFLKVKPNRTEIEGFKTNLITLLDRTNDTESEEFHKNLVSDFLKDTYYKQNHFINTKGRNDLVIHNGQNATSTVGVILEAKKPTNKNEMITTKRLNTKALQELVLYYLRERITHKNLEVKLSVATNINEWFIFDEHLFERLFAQNKSFVRQFENFEASKKTTDVFYKEIAEPFIDNITSEIEFTYFNFQDFQKPLRNADKADDNSLIALFKLLSPEHLLKLPFTNDSNSLDKRFYSELLHIIGLTETKEGSKKLIGRNEAGERHTGTILEDAIIQLDSLDKLNRLEKPNQFGSTQQERLFNVALELSITWINRILFLKLLEAQLITYHRFDKLTTSKGDKSFSFLNLDKIKNYDDLNSLFFQVLARKYDERNEDVIKVFEKVPYLNSSLFEPTEIEQVTLFISNLKDDKAIPIFSQSVLKNEQGKKRSGNISTLQYLFEFLDAYDFGAEGGSAIQEDNKTLINASVLGLIFEKINGYKDGSFFTPGFITMYMCRETIRKAIVQKFNETKRWNCTTLEELYDKIDDRKEANKIVNSIKICDPAVGSGHFLVSALNEMIAVKNDLKILQDRDGKRLKEYQVEVVNDELIVTDEEGELFEYNPGSAGSLCVSESQRIQEALFHEKQTIIENCLFGVDINSNSVKICRLRLWIELLKNAYYIQSSSPKLGEVSEGRRGQEQFNNLPHLKTFRKNLRNNLTPAEAKLWTMLKGKQMEGRKFRRQHSFANYILDFYCPEERLAIELDGQGHFEVTQAEYDKERDLFLETFGIRVLRFENKWVWDNPEGLLETIRGYFGKQPPRQPVADTPPYKGGELRELQTLPNIDINIKCGNSLVSRFAIDADLKQALRKSKWTIDSYRIAVDTYRNAESKEQKREMERLIADIKSDFRSEISLNDPKVKKLRKLSGELFQMTNQQQLFEMSKKEKADWNKKVTQLTEETKKLEAEIEEIKANKIFENAFEWRFEFPEVLNDDGDFVGFDVVIGNPPYISHDKIEYREYLKYTYKCFEAFADLYCYFFEKGISILSARGYLNFITSNSFLKAEYGKPLRDYFNEFGQFVQLINIEDAQIFEDAIVNTVVANFAKGRNDIKSQIVNQKYNIQNNFIDFIQNHSFDYTYEDFKIKSWNLAKPEQINLGRKIYEKGKSLEELGTKIRLGIATGSNEAFVIDKETVNSLITNDPKSIDLIKPLLRGKDINRYSYEQEKYILLTKNGINVEKDYPAIFKYLASFGENFRNRGAKGIHWTNLRACSFFDDFKEPKIIWIELTDTNKFAICYDEIYLLNSAYFLLPPKELEINFLTGLLNSKTIKFYLKLIANTSGVGTTRWINIYVKEFPIARNEALESKITNIVQQINLQKKNNRSADTADLETQIDQLVYQLYELTEEEIKIVEAK